jgi:predicted NAD/FAD-dependent oxidoreductase
VGGRLSTRRIGPGLADHGAQFFTVRDPEFDALAQRWLADGIVYEWARGWNDGSLAVTRDGHPRYAVRGGFNALAKRLAEGLTTRINIRVTTVRQNGDGWQAQDELGNMYSGRALLLTAPVPQSLALIDAGSVALSPEDRGSLEQIEYAPSLTGMFWIEGWEGLPPPGAIQRPQAHLSWIADNRRKGISPQALILTVQANGTYSSELWELADNRILAAFKTDLLPFVHGSAKYVEAQLKRWRYAQATILHPERVLLANGLPPLAFAGDAFKEGRVEGAVLSGLHAGRALAERLA